MPESFRGIGFADVLETLARDGSLHERFSMETWSRSEPRLAQRNKQRQPLDLPPASAFTSSVVRDWPPIPQSPLLTSSRTTTVTGRIFSPSIDTIGSQICCDGSRHKTIPSDLLVDRA